MQEQLWPVSIQVGCMIQKITAERVGKGNETIIAVNSLIADEVVSVNQKSAQCKARTEASTLAGPSVKTGRRHLYNRWKA